MTAHSLESLKQFLRGTLLLEVTSWKKVVLQSSLWSDAPTAAHSAGGVGFAEQTLHFTVGRAHFWLSSRNGGEGWVEAVAGKAANNVTAIKTASIARENIFCTSNNWEATKI
jgi:hypothetical protein